MIKCIQTKLMVIFLLCRDLPNFPCDSCKALDLWLEEVQKIDEICRRVTFEKRYRLNKKFSDITKQIPQIPNQRIEKPNFIVNLSKENFTEKQLELLNKGLKHRIIPKKPPIEEIVVNIEASLRVMNLKETEKNEIRFDCKNV
jgi:hypothetical protein